MPLPDVLQLVADTVLRQTLARGALVELLQGHQLVAQASAGDHVRPVGHLLAVDQSLLWPALREGRTVVGNDTEAEGWDMASLPHRHGVRSVRAVPLRTAQGVVGSLKVTSDKPNAFSRRDVAHLEILTESLGAMVQLRHVAGQLKASEQQYRMLFNEHPHPMWVYDKETLRLQAVNQSMETHYGYSEAELLTMDMTELWPAERHATIREALHAIAIDQRNKPVISRHVKKDGSFMDVEITAGSISFNGRPARQVLATDVTERLRTERELARMGRAQRLLSACNETLVRATSETALLQAICQIAVDIGGYRMGWVGFALDDERKSIQPVAHAGYNQNYLENLQLSWSADDPYGRGPAGMAVRSGKPATVPLACCTSTRRTFCRSALKRPPCCRNSPTTWPLASPACARTRRSSGCRPRCSRWRRPCRPAPAPSFLCSWCATWPMPWGPRAAAWCGCCPKRKGNHPGWSRWRRCWTARCCPTTNTAWRARPASCC